MEQQIEAPTQEEMEYIAKQLIYSSSLIEEITNSDTTGTITDLELIQKVIDSNFIQPDATNELCILGLALGLVFINENAGYDWWMVEDEYGRDPAIRYKETSITAFPETMILRRIEDGEEIDVKEIYFGLIEMLNEIREKHYKNA